MPIFDCRLPILIAPPVNSDVMLFPNMNQILAMTPLIVAVVSAVWVYWHFLIRREAEPGAEIEVNVDFVGKQDGKWLIEVSAILTNRSFVRHYYRNFQLKIRYLLSADEVKDGGEKTNFQLNFPRTIDERLNDGCRFFANAAYIDPKLTFRHSYITYIPADATFLWVQCKLLFPPKRHWLRSKDKMEMKNTQRLFKVPEIRNPSDGSE